MFGTIRMQLLNLLNPLTAHESNEGPAAPVTLHTWPRVAPVVNWTTTHAS